MGTLGARIIGTLAVMGLAAAVMVVGVTVRALALVVLWRWFVVPTFGLAELGVAQAGGLMTILYLMGAGRTHTSKLAAPARPEPERPRSVVDALFDLAGLIAVELVVPALALAVGWVFKRAL